MCVVRTKTQCTQDLLQCWTRNIRWFRFTALKFFHFRDNFFALNFNRLYNICFICICIYKIKHEPNHMKSEFGKNLHIHKTKTKPNTSLNSVSWAHVVFYLEIFASFFRSSHLFCTHCINKLIYTAHIYFLLLIHSADFFP